MGGAEAAVGTATACTTTAYTTAMAISTAIAAPPVRII
jgi:hypothetical protein